MTWKRAIAYGIPIAIVATIAVAMARGPTYRALSFEGCRREYNRALTRADTNRIDRHPYRNERDNRRVRHTCGEIRAVIANQSIPILDR